MKIAIRRSLLALASLVWTAGCRDGSAPIAPEHGRPSLEILDGSSTEGTPHFFFLPPLVQDPTTTGVLDTSVGAFLIVEICQWTGSACILPALARFTTSSGPGSETIRMESEHYIVNWHTDQFALATEDTYRIRVQVAGTDLGHADVQPVATGKELKNIDSSEAVGLVDGRTLPIRFRIEKEAVFVIGSAGGTITAMNGVVTLEIPEGALSNPAGIIVRPARQVPEDSGMVSGSAFELAPEETSFRADARLTLGYDPARVPAGIDPTALKIHSILDAAWVEVPDSHVDVDSARAEASIHELGTFGVLRERAVASVTVEPDSVQVAVGDTTRLHATPRDAHGQPLQRPVEWLSTAPSVAEVDASGRVTGLASGRAQIQARSGNEHGVVRVIVVDPAYPHQPPGFIQLTERPFDAAEEDFWRTVPTPDFQIVEDSTAPKSPPNVGQARFPAGFVGGDGPILSEFGDFSFLGYRKLYMSFWLKVSENWQGQENFINKIGFVWMHSDPVFVPMIKGRDAEPLRSRIALQDIPVVIARNLDANVGAVEIVRGRWHRWEIVFIANTGDNADGEVHWWIDGTKVGEYTDVTVRSSTQSDRLQYVTWYPIWGGGFDIVIETMYMWMDHFYASASP